MVHHDRPSQQAEEGLRLQEVQDQFQSENLLNCPRDSGLVLFGDNETTTTEEEEATLVEFLISFFCQG